MLQAWRKPSYLVSSRSSESCSLTQLNDQSPGNYAAVKAHLSPADLLGCLGEDL